MVSMTLIESKLEEATSTGDHDYIRAQQESRRMLPKGTKQNVAKKSLTVKVIGEQVKSFKGKTGRAQRLQDSTHVKATSSEIHDYIKAPLKSVKELPKTTRRTVANIRRDLKVLPNALTIQTHTVRVAIDFTQQNSRCHAWNGDKEMESDRLLLLSARRKHNGHVHHSHSFSTSLNLGFNSHSRLPSRHAPGGDRPLLLEDGAYFRSSILSRRYTSMQYILHAKDSFMSESFLPYLLGACATAPSLIVLYDRGVRDSAELAIAIIGVDIDQGQGYFCPVDTEGQVHTSDMHFFGDTKACWPICIASAIQNPDDVLFD